MPALHATRFVRFSKPMCPCMACLLVHMPPEFSSMLCAVEEKTFGCSRLQ